MIDLKDLIYKCLAVLSAMFTSLITEAAINQWGRYNSVDNGFQRPHLKTASLASGLSLISLNVIS